MNAIITCGLSKQYRERRALDSIDLTVAEGSIFGFLGPNGAGKTTTLRILLGLAKPTGGSASILGHDVNKTGNDVRRLIGFVPDVPGFYSWMSASQYMRFAGSLFGLRGDVLESRVASLLDLAGLTGVRQKIGAYSRGMKQRLGIAQALINAPKLLLLDEPTSALDPLGRKDVLDLINSLRGKTTVFFSTHILSDVERVCDTCAILNEGRLMTQAPLVELRQRYGGSTRVLVDVDQNDALAGVVMKCSWAQHVTVTDRGVLIGLRDLASCQREIPQLCGQYGLLLRRFEPLETSLEDVFVSLVEGGRA